MNTLITVVHVLTCIFLVIAVLVQSGKGAEISASFGGSSQTVFGTSGGANFLVKFTQGAAAVFMITSILLTILGGQNRKSLFETPGAVPAVPAQTAPAAPAQNQAAPAVPAQGAPAQAPAEKK
jgi:preprotein translocase subunit SecG